jgi:hypothetical protein
VCFPSHKDQRCFGSTNGSPPSGDSGIQAPFLLWIEAIFTMPLQNALLFGISVMSIEDSDGGFYESVQEVVSIALITFHQ